MTVDPAWVIETARHLHEYAGLGAPIEPEKIAEVLGHCNVRRIGDGFIAGVEVPLIYGSVPVVNHVVMWDGSPMVALLDAHEAASPLPSSVSVLLKRPRSAALVRALRARGYHPQEMTMVKTWAA